MADIDLGWAFIASAIYFSLYFLLLMSLAYYVHKTGDYTNKKSFLLAVWKKKSIYGQILLHLYDTATDVGVLVEWYILAEGEKKGENVESLDMNSLFWTSIGFIIVYRFFSIIIGAISGYSDGEENAQQIKMCFFDAFLGLIDMYVIKAVYKAIKGQETEPTVKQKMIQLGEAILESLPQVVLQSVYIVRGQNDPQIRGKSTLSLVGLSLLASLLSITNKYIWFDKEGVKKEAKHDQLSIKLPLCCKHSKGTDSEQEIQETKNKTNNIDEEKEEKETKEDRTDTKASKTAESVCSCDINKWYLLRIVWRFSYIITRFSVLSLIWSVLGGAFLGIYMSIAWCMWFIFAYIEIAEYFNPWAIMTAMGIGIFSLGASPAYDAFYWAIGHGIEMLIIMTMITVFAFNLSFECGICAKPDDRNAMSNDYILSFIITGWIAMIVDFVTYFVMLYYEKFDDEILSVLNILDEGIQQ